MIRLGRFVGAFALGRSRRQWLAFVLHDRRHSAAVRMMHVGTCRCSRMIMIMIVVVVMDETVLQVLFAENLSASHNVGIFDNYWFFTCIEKSTR